MISSLPRIWGFARRPLVRVAVGVVVAAGLLVLVLQKVSLSHALYSLEHVSLLLFGLGALSAIGYVALRAWRYRLLLGRGSPLSVMGVTAASWGAGQVLPGPGSDAAFVWLAHSDLDASVSRGTGAALVARLLDLASLALILLVSADLAGVRLPRPVRVSAIVLGVGLALLLVTLFIRGPRGWLLGRVERLPILGPLAVRGEVALSQLSSWPMVAALVGATIGARLLAAVEYICLFAAVGAHLTIWQVWLALAVRTMLFALPVQGVGGMGTSQIWWAGGLTLAGFPLAAALALGLEVQLLDLLVALPEGLVGWLGLRARRLLRNRSSASSNKGIQERVRPAPAEFGSASPRSRPGSGQAEPADLAAAGGGAGRRR